MDPESYGKARRCTGAHLGRKEKTNFNAQRRAVVGRRDVQTAIQRVGRVESYRLEGGQ
jgi:hypothetical protein